MYTHTHALTHIHARAHTYTYSHTYIIAHAGTSERWGAGVEYHFQEFNEPYAPS